MTGIAAPQEPVVLVDDIVSSGAQMIGAALRLRATFPELEIVGYAVIRVVKPEGFERISFGPRKVAKEPRELSVE